MARISVVVPVFDVESYLATCLQSIARQSERDLEVIMVDDGSTDGSRALAERFACHDRRFRLLEQPNGGLGKARNTGIDAASGEFLAFVDSDDVLPPDAYARLLGALDASGSDLASGNVQRLTRQGTSQAQFLARTFARTRLRTHVGRWRPLLADRTAWNKLYRRTFWDAHGLRFPEGVVHEDIPLTLPAHQLAAAVDVIAAPVYRWRLREDGAPSITQRRLELRVLRDRLAAIDAVRAHFAAHAPGRLCRWYDASIVADDLRLHLDVLAEADDEYRALFVSRANALLAGAPWYAFARLSAIDRLKWELVRAERVDELVELLRSGAAPVRRAGRHYVGNHRLGRRDEHLALTARLDEVRTADGKLRLRGTARIGALPVDHISLRLAGRPVPAAPTRDGGFEAALDPRQLKEGQTLFMFATARRGLLVRRRRRFELGSPQLIGAYDLDGTDGMRRRALVTADGIVRVDVRRAYARLASRRVSGGVLELTGELRRGGEPRLELCRRSDGRVHAYDVAIARGGFRARIPLGDLVVAPPSLEAVATGDAGAPEMWDVTVAGHPLGLPEPLDGIDWTVGRHEVALTRTRQGDAALVTRRVVQPIVPEPAAQPTAPASIGSRDGSHSERT